MKLKSNHAQQLSKVLDVQVQIEFNFYILYL